MARAKEELCARFGYGGVEIENDQALGPKAQLRLIEAMSQQLSEAARSMGTRESDLGFEGAWTLRIIDAPVHINAFGQSAFIDSDAKCLAAPVSPGALMDIEHEWTHALDRELFDRAREAAGRVGADKAPFWRAQKPFFSLLPPEAQDFLPLAKEGYLRVAGAGQNVDGARGFEALAQAERNLARQARERIADEMLQSLSGLPGGGWESLGAGEQEALRESIVAAAGHLANGELARAHALRLADPLRALGRARRLDQELLEQGEESSTRAALGIIAEALEAQWGSAWRAEPGARTPERPGKTGRLEDTGAGGIEPGAMEGPKAVARQKEARPGEPGESGEPDAGWGAIPQSEPIERAARLFALAIERHQGLIAQAGWSNGSGPHPLNPESPFARASKSVSAGGQARAGYWDSAHEMLARSAARPQSLRERLGVFGQTQAHSVPEMGSRQQRWLARGWAQLTEAAGLAPAERPTSARDALEALYVDTSRASRAALGSARAKLSAFRQARAQTPTAQTPTAQTPESFAPATARARAADPAKAAPGQARSPQALPDARSPEPSADGSAGSEGHAQSALPRQLNARRALKAARSARPSGPDLGA